VDLDLRSLPKYSLTVDLIMKVTLANSKFFTQQPAKSILDSGLDQGVVLEHGCSNGKCGVCKASVLSGATKQLRSEFSLTDDEQNSGEILTCCRAAVTDIELNIEDLGALAQQKSRLIPSRIDSIQSLSPNIIVVELRLPANEKLDYFPGQYIEITAPGNITRSYSLANAPRADNKLQLHIRKVPDGAMSQYWFEKAKVGDLLRFFGPRGTFIYRHQQIEHLILLATGTGIAPIRAILQQQPNVANIHLYWGGRTEADIYCQIEVSEHLHYHPLLSRAGSGWQGRKGYVQQAVIDDQIPLEKSSVYACGSKQMIHSSRQLLVQSGLNPKQFYSDAFVSSAK